MSRIPTLRQQWWATVALALWLMVMVPSMTMADEPTRPIDPPPGASTVAPPSPAPMTDIHDIRPPVPVGFDAPWLGPALLTLATIVLLAVLVWWWRRRRKTQAIETIVPELPPETIAKAALDRISDVRGQEAKAFYFELSAILRQYVHGRFDVGAPEMTTEEFVPCIDRLAIDRDLARQFKQLCRAMDPVKFAGQDADERQMEKDLFFARAFVRQTTQHVETGEQSEELVADNENSKNQIPMLKQ